MILILKGKLVSLLFFWKDLSSSSSLRDLSCEESVFLFPWCFADLLFWWSRSERRCFPSSSVYCLNRRWELFLFFFILIFENLLLDDLNHKEKYLFCVSFVKKEIFLLPWRLGIFLLDGLRHKRKVFPSSLVDYLNLEIKSFFLRIIFLFPWYLRIFYQMISIRKGNSL